MRFLALFIVSLILGLPEPASAMHISEGILPVGWALFWYVISAPFLIVGLRTLARRSAKDPFTKPFVGLVGAAVFVISCMPIPVPVAGTCSHPCGAGLAAILLGPSLTVLITSVALTLQALFLAHGGISTLGANTFSMGVIGGFTGYGVFIGIRRLGLPVMVAAFAAGLFSDWATYAATSFILAGSLHFEASFSTMFLTILLAFTPTQVPLGILEGIISAGAYNFIHSRRPEFLPAAQRSVS